MEYENPLDNAIHRFQHRWETDRQFRSAMSGVFGLLLIVVLCSGVSLLDMGATRVLAAVGIGGASNQTSGSSQPNIDTGVVINGNTEFPTTTIPTWPVPVIPQAQPNPTSSSLPPTATPVPTATDVPTTGPCKSNCGSGPTVAVTASNSPTHWLPGQPASISFYTTSTKDGSVVPNDGINAFIHWSNGAQWLSATTPGAPQATDGSGVATWSLTVPADTRCGGTVTVDYSANDHGTPVYGTRLSIRCN